MITVRCQAGLGNQMFQYALARALNMKHRRDVVLDKSWFLLPVHITATPRTYGLDNFNIAISTVNATPFKFLLLRALHRIPGLKKNLALFGFYKELPPNEIATLAIPHEAFFEGWFQSEDYFSFIRQELLSELSLKLPSRRYSELSEIIERENAVLIHLRHGDRLSDHQKAIFGYLADTDYYEKGIQEIKDKVENPFFVLISDDKDALKSKIVPKLPKEANFLILSDEHLKDYEEMLVASKCKHFIIVNSSFSWWCAWLGEKDNSLIISPKDWYAQTALTKGVRTTFFKATNSMPYKIVPDRWIKI